MSDVPEDPQERSVYLKARDLIEWPPGSETIYTAETWARLPKDLIQEQAVFDFIWMAGGRPVSD